MADICQRHILTIIFTFRLFGTLYGIHFAFRHLPGKMHKPNHPSYTRPREKDCFSREIIVY